MAGIISRTLTAPLDLYKIQCQNSYLTNSTFRNVIRREGVRHLWKGNAVNVCRVFPQYSVNYALYIKCNNGALSDIKHPKVRHFSSGLLAGAGAMFIVYPLETIRTRLSLQMNKSHYSSPIDVIRKLSIRQLYKGVGISMLGFGPFSAFNFMFFDIYSDYLTKQMDDSVAKFLAGGLAGVSSITFTYPTDLLRRHFQMADFNKDVPKYKGIADAFMTVIRNEGIRGLYKGLLPTYIKIFPCLAIQFWCLDKGKSLMVE